MSIRCWLNVQRREDCEGRADGRNPTEGGGRERREQVRWRTGRGRAPLEIVPFFQILAFAVFGRGVRFLCFRLFFV